MSDRYPRHPRAAVLAVVPRLDGDTPRLLMVRRANKPDPGRWGYPGGKVELGESLHTAAVRELAEETGVDAVPLASVWAGDVIRRDITGAIVYHYILTAVLCRWKAGEPVAASDATEAAWMTRDDIESLPEAERSPDVLRVARLSLGIAGKLGR